MQTAGHRCHDYEYLIRRWKKIARATRSELVLLTEADGLPVYYLQTRTLQAKGGAYLSAGIHGDEAASTDGLAAWAELNLRSLREQPFLIFPCLNPWGLINNIRTDGKGRDLNRIFHLPRRSALIREWNRLMIGREFSFCHLMHEDYDALGCYVYEIRSILPHWGEQMLEAARIASGIGPDPRPRIEGRPAKGGVVRRRFPRGLVPWTPEALALFYGGHSSRVFTFETPSEFSLEARTCAHAAVIDAAIELSQIAP